MAERGEARLKAAYLLFLTGQPEPWQLLCRITAEKERPEASPNNIVRYSDHARQYCESVLLFAFIPHFWRLRAYEIALLQTPTLQLPHDYSVPKIFLQWSNGSQAFRVLMYYTTVADSPLPIQMYP